MASQSQSPFTNGKPHARRFLHAARIMNQKLPNSGIPLINPPDTALSNHLQCARSGRC